MSGYAIFSGISIMMAIPLLDFVFKPGKTKILYSDFPAFFGAVRDVFNNFLSQQNSFFTWIDKINYKPFLTELKSILEVTDPIFLLWFISISVIFLIVLKNIFYYGNRVMFINLQGKTIKDIRDIIYHKYLYQPLSFLRKNKVGDSLVRMVSDVNIISNFFINSFFNIIRDIILLVVYIIIALNLNLKLFIIGLVLLPLFSYLVNLLGGKIKKYSQRIQEQSSQLFSNVEEKLNSMPIVKAFSRENYEYDRFEKINKKHFRFWRKSLLYSAVNVPLSELNSVLIGVVILMIGGKLVLAADSSFSFGTFMTFLLAVFSMMQPTKNLTNAYINIRKALVSLDRIMVILDRKSEITESKEQVEKRDFEQKIVFNDIAFSYQEDKKVLENINFEVKKGEKIALVGSSGSGKTTLVHLLSRMYDPDAGDILIDGIPSHKIKLKDLRTLFGTVTQESILFNDTVFNNISYGTLEKVDEEQVRNAAKIAFADEFIDKLPQKYDEILQVKASNLSGGQRQRLCIARAIVGNPPILIFDEATSSLDTEAERKVQQAIEQATKNRTVIVIAHRLSTILSSDKIIVLDQGKIVCIGHHKELLETCERYKTLYNIQFEMD